MRIKILVSCSGLSFSFSAGETVETTAAIAKDLIKAGYAEEVKTAKKTKGDGDADPDNK